MVIKTKFNVGQQLYGMHNNAVQKFTIENININVDINHSTNEAYTPSFTYKLRVGESAGHRLEVDEYEINLKFFTSKKALLSCL